MVKCDLLRSHVGMGVLLQICCIFSEHLFQEHLLRVASEIRQL